LLFIVLLFGVMYFLMIRPQQKRRREAMQMQAALAPGDQIVTIGGLHATVVAIDADVVTVEIAPGVNVRYARPAIARIVERGTAADEEPVTPDEEPEIQSPIIETRKSTD
jgi:preprotein translocase subunit YajC